MCVMICLSFLLDDKYMHHLRTLRGSQTVEYGIASPSNSLGASLAPMRVMGGMGISDVCMSQCAQQCHSTGGGLMAGTMRHLRHSAQSPYLQGGISGPMAGLMGGMGLMGGNNGGVMTVSGGNRALPVGGLNGMQAGQINGVGAMASVDNLLTPSAVHVTETVKTVSPVGQVAVKG
ncbi:uncharacterized protein LOC111268935 isoform X3 [Varroa jacobsoni]|uniref:uncharacterized protein LOC111268935 isoform X3 n=1 Tax=Varroa jacobsoni TaxID=62625 RepID=UPI000BF25F72|nr:uncharacterized protein LOC111268935 isoform X3 [Varroa jacobsoni]